MTLAEKIMTLRKKQGWSQEDLADRLDISRQSVSKWESGASVPDLDKIVNLSVLFGVSTDYLLKDESGQMVEISYSEAAPVQEPDSARTVTAEEANAFMEISRIFAGKIAVAVPLFICSPIVLIFLAGLSEEGLYGITEAAAEGIGLTVLFVFVAVGVVLAILYGMQIEKYEYLEKEAISLQHGVREAVQRKKEAHAPTYRKCVAFGVVCCIVAVIPLMIAGAMEAGEVTLVYCTALLLALIALGVSFIVWSACIQGGFDKLLEEGDYTPEKKHAKRRVAWLPGIYWGIVTAAFLAVSLSSNEWGSTWIIWPVASVLYAAVYGIMQAVCGRRERR